MFIPPRQTPSGPLWMGNNSGLLNNATAFGLLAKNNSPGTPQLPASPSGGKNPWAVPAPSQNGGISFNTGLYSMFGGSNGAQQAQGPGAMGADPGGLGSVAPGTSKLGAYDALQQMLWDMGLGSLTGQPMSPQHTAGAQMQMQADPSLFMNPTPFYSPSVDAYGYGAGDFGGSLLGDGGGTFDAGGGYTPGGFGW